MRERPYMGLLSLHGVYRRPWAQVGSRRRTGANGSKIPGFSRSRDWKGLISQSGNPDSILESHAPLLPYANLDICLHTSGGSQVVWKESHRTVIIACGVTWVPRSVSQGRSANSQGPLKDRPGGPGRQPLWNTVGTWCDGGNYTSFCRPIPAV